MKKLKVIIPILLWLIPMSTIWVTITKNSNIFDVIDYIKEIIKFDNVTINSDIPYSTIQDAIDKYCPTNAIDDAKTKIKSLTNARSTINTNNEKQVLTDRFNLLKQNINNTNKTDEYKYCQQSYLYFSLLKVTQELYNGDRAVKSTTTTNTSKTTTKTTTQAQTNTITKKETNTNQNKTTQTHNAATNRLNFTFNHDTSWLPSQIKDNFYKDTEKYLQETISDLVSKNILDYSDIQRLNWKINVTYQQSCKTTEWDFRVTRNKSTWKYTFKEINLIIAYCETNTTTERHQRHVKQILAHELWHYIYFFKDNNPSAFSEICRNNGKINCLTSEFVTSYARKSPEEDYAESFAYRYLNSKKDTNKNHNAPNDNPINQRERHFERLFEEMEEDDEDDEKE